MFIRATSAWLVAERLFGLLLERAGNDQCHVRKEILALFGEKRALWISDRRFVREINQKLQVWTENPLLSDTAKGLLVQMKEAQIETEK
jgi:hypothetical protein